MICSNLWKKCDVGNYADDNTISFSHESKEIWKSTLEAEAGTMVDWFEFNGMQANPGKFQAIVFSSAPNPERPSFTIKGAHIECLDDVKLLGVTVDQKLNFDAHV